MKYINTFTDSSVEKLFNITKLVLFDYREFKGDIPENYESHNFWEMVYVCKGSIYEVSNNKQIPLKTGDLLFLAPNQPHSSVKADDNEAVVCFISFLCNSEAMLMFKNYKTSVTKNILPLVKTLIHEGRSAFRVSHKNNTTMLIKRADSPLGSSQLYVLYLEALLINLLRERYEDMPRKPFVNKRDIKNSMATEIQKYLSDNIYNTLTIDNICKKFKYEKSFICLAFKEVFGESIISYYNRLKITEACHLIEEDEYSLKEISEKLCFNNQYYFSRLFKAITNKTPTEYKSKVIDN